MGTAYTPGLKISPGTTIRKTRRLPMKGQVVVAVGDRVKAEDVVARTDIPGVIQTVKVAEMIGLEPPEAIAALKVGQGDKVERGQIVAESRSFFGLFKSECKSPIAGTVELISHATGHIGVRLAPAPVEVAAYIDGTVVEVMPDEGVVVEAFGAFVQGIFGVGGERMGRLVLPTRSIDAALTEDAINESHAGAVLVGGSGVTLGALNKAGQVGARGVVVGAIVDTDLIAYLGHDIGVAITGHEDIPISVVLTEGFGSIQMAQRTFDLLASLEGREVSINGATQIRAGVIRPEIVAPIDPTAAHTEVLSKGQVLDIGSNIRVIREPYFGKLGTVTKLPHEPVEVESGAVVRVLEAQLDDGEAVLVPRANVEIIEE
jgi:hypothetical protein